MTSFSFQKTLSGKEYEIYLKMLINLAIMVDPSLLVDKVNITQKITELLNGYMQNPQIQFIIAKENDQIIGLASLEMDKENPNLLRLMQIALKSPTDYLTLGKEMVIFVKNRYPTYTIYGFVNENNKYGLGLIEEFDGNLLKDFDHPIAKPINGWLMYILEPVGE